MGAKTCRVLLVLLLASVMLNSAEGLLSKLLKGKASEPDTSAQPVQEAKPGYIDQARNGIKGAATFVGGLINPFGWRGSKGSESTTSASQVTLSGPAVSVPVTEASSPASVLPDENVSRHADADGLSDKKVSGYGKSEDEEETSDKFVKKFGSAIALAESSVKSVLEVIRESNRSQNSSTTTGTSLSGSSTESPESKAGFIQRARAGLSHVASYLGGVVKH